MSNHQISKRLLRASIGRTATAVPSQESWDCWIEYAVQNRVVPLLHACVSVDPTDLLDEQRHSIQDMQLYAMGMVVRFEHRLLEVASVLRREQIQFLILKGQGAAVLDYLDPSLRQYGDVDILVAPVDFDAAVNTLTSFGWTQPYRLSTRGRKFAHAVTLTSSKMELDVHQFVARKSLGLLIPTQSVFAEATRVNLAGGDFLAPSGRDRLIISAIHMLRSRGPYRRLSSTADVLVMSVGSDSPESVLRRADSWSIRGLVEFAIREAHRLAEVELAPHWTNAMSAPTRNRSRLIERAYLGERRRPVTEEIAFMLRMSPGDQYAYMRANLEVPTRGSPRERAAQVGWHTRRLLSRARDRS